MDEEAGILREIVENPDDVTHRLVYADWLEEHGKSRLAEFIRAQCAFRAFLVDREGTVRVPVAIEIMWIEPDVRVQLLEAFRPVYEDLKETREPMETVLPNHFRFWVHRGLVEDLEVCGGAALTAFVRHAKRIFSTVPLIRLTISASANREAWHIYTPVSVHNAPESPVGLGEIRALVEVPEVGRLRSLDLQHLGLGNALGECVLRSSPDFHPRRLLLSGNLIQEPMIHRLQNRFADALVLPPHSPEDEIPF
jgi:uncharacterized protein (TIGR02996 family)